MIAPFGESLVIGLLVGSWRRGRLTVISLFVPVSRSGYRPALLRSLLLQPINPMETGIRQKIFFITLLFQKVGPEQELLNRPSPEFQTRRSRTHARARCPLAFPLFKRSHCCLIDPFERHILFFGDFFA